MFMSVSAAGDRANNDPASAMPTAGGPAALWKWFHATTTRGCARSFRFRAAVIAAPWSTPSARRRFWANNPLRTTAKMEIRPVLPAFLLTRGWTMVFDNPGGGSFSLGPTDTRVIRPRLIGGQNFTAAEVMAAGAVAIQIVVLADGLVVGGLTFALDPKLHHPPHEKIEEKHEEEHEHQESHGRIRVARTPRVA